jgi:arylsulfatase
VAAYVAANTTSSAARNYTTRGDVTEKAPHAARCGPRQQITTEGGTMADEFKGVIQLDVRDSLPDWGPYTLARAPEGAPNILVILYDDTGLAAWSPYGGRIEMPTLQRLADNGLTYTQWHTTALCSPTRSVFLTGRNHHVNRCACIM